jgi:hypothetical protein
MALFTGGGADGAEVTHIPTVAREVYDVTGAGDKLSQRSRWHWRAVPPAKRRRSREPCGGCSGRQGGHGIAHARELLAISERQPNSIAHHETAR